MRIRKIKRPSHSRQPSESSTNNQRRRSRLIRSNDPTPRKVSDAGSGTCGMVNDSADCEAKELPQSAMLWLPLDKASTALSPPPPPLENTSNMNELPAAKPRPAKAN